MMFKIKILMTTLVLEAFSFSELYAQAQVQKLRASWAQKNLPVYCSQKSEGFTQGQVTALSNYLELPVIQNSFQWIEGFSSQEGSVFTGNSASLVVSASNNRMLYQNNISGNQLSSKKPAPSWEDLTSTLRKLVDGFEIPRDQILKKPDGTWAVSRLERKIKKVIGGKEEILSRGIMISRQIENIPVRYEGDADEVFVRYELGQVVQLRMQWLQLKKCGLKSLPTLAQIAELIHKEKYTTTPHSISPEEPVSKITFGETYLSYIEEATTRPNLGRRFVPAILVETELKTPSEVLDSEILIPLE